MEKRKRCYISGPITGVDNYLDVFDKYEYDITQVFGWSVINPARVNESLPKDTSYEEYMEMSMTMMKMCDRIFLLPNWEKSKGARFEQNYALIRGMVIYEEDSEGNLRIAGGGDMK